jgi:O-antigen ligase
MQKESLSGILNTELWSKGILTFYISAILMVVLPVYHWYLPPFMIFWGFLWLVELRLKIFDWENIEKKKKILFILFLLFFGWQLIGMIYSDNHKEGWRNIELRLSLLLFPLVLIAPGCNIRLRIRPLLRLFSLATFAFILVCFGYAMYRSLSSQNGVVVFNPHPPIDTWLNYFYGSEFAIFQHPSYLSMFLLLSIFIAFESVLDKTNKMVYQSLWLVISIILLLSIYLLSSRAEILAAIITIPLFFLFKFRNSGKKKVIILSAILCVFILIPILVSNPRFKYYMQIGKETELTTKMLNESRLSIWKVALNIISEFPVLGVGTGDIQDELNEGYRLSGSDDLKVNYTMNAHNQFLEIILEHGLIGLSIFIAILAVMFYIAFSEKNILYMMFLFIVIFSFLFETMLNRLAGVSFFSLFSFLLIHIESKTDN